MLVLSAAAVLALGRAHLVPPTMSGQQKSTTSKASTPAEQSVPPEKALAHYIVVLYDTQLLMNEQAGINLMEGTWANDASGSMNSLSKALTSSSAELKKFTFSDSKKETARKDLIHCNNQLAADFIDMAKACHQATSNKGWDSTSTSLANKAFTDSKSLPTDGSIDKLIKDPTFQTNLPQMFLESHNLIPDVNGFKLGVRFLVLDPLHLVYVQPGGLASTLQLQSLDDVIDVNGKQPKDMDDFKSMLKQSAGQTITLHVKRLGITDTSFQATVPANLTAPRL